MRKLGMSVLFAACLGLFPMGTLLDSAHAAEYEALKDVKSVSTMYDFRDGKVQSGLDHLKLIHETYKDQAVRAISEKPKFVVIFMGPSVMLLSKDREKFSEEEKKKLAEFDSVLSAMDKDGIHLEVCKVAIDYFKVAPDSIASEIKRVDNGWIASLGYQHKDYSLVPVF